MLRNDVVRKVDLECGASHRCSLARLNRWLGVKHINLRQPYRQQSTEYWQLQTICWCRSRGKTNDTQKRYKRVFARKFDSLFDTIPRRRQRPSMKSGTDGSHYRGYDVISSRIMEVQVTGINGCDGPTTTENLQIRSYDRRIADSLPMKAGELRRAPGVETLG